MQSNADYISFMAVTNHHYLKDRISSIFLSPSKHFFPHLNCLLNVELPSFKKPNKK